VTQRLVGFPWPLSDQIRLTILAQFEPDDANKTNPSFELELAQACNCCTYTAPVGCAAMNSMHSRSSIKMGLPVTYSFPGEVLQRKVGWLCGQ